MADPPLPRAAADPPGPPFSCEVPTFFLSQQNPTRLYTGVYGPGTATITTLGPPWTAQYNALGFNPNDGYLYAVQYAPTDGPNVLLQIDSNGNTFDLGPITDLPRLPAGPNNGAFDAAGNFWVTNTNAANAWEIDVASNPPAVVRTLPLSGVAWGGYDLSFADGFMWGMSGNPAFIYRLNLTTGNVDRFSAPSGVVGGTYGATWTYSNGNLGFSDNGSGRIFQISVANAASASPAFAVVSSYQGPSSSNNDGSVCIAPPVDLGITKTGPAQVAQGGTVTWTSTVTNHGRGNSSGFGVHDVVPAGFTNVTSTTAGCVVTGNTVDCSEGALSNGSSRTISVTATATAAPGSCLTNSVMVFGNEEDPNPANDSASVQTCVLGIELTKSASISHFDAPGTTITYTYRVHNPSTVPLTAVTVTDDRLGTITCPSDILAADASMICTADYTTSQQDVDGGGITNLATATGQAQGITVTDQSSVTVVADENPAITLEKSANVSSFAEPGVEVTYSYLVENTGNETLNPVTVTDPLDGLSGISCPQVSLAPGQSMTCTATYFTTQDDVDAGGVKNTGTATGHPPSGPDVTARSSVTIQATQSPAISLEKSGVPPSYALPGTTMTYQYLVRNTGNVTLNPITVTDNSLGLITSCESTSLAPGQFMVCEASRTITGADIDRGRVSNTATATGQPPVGTPVSDRSRTTVRLAHTPAISMVKSAGLTSYEAPDTTIDYTYLVTNSGNVTLHAIRLTDNTLGQISCPLTVLSAGADMTCTATYTTTQADVDRGRVDNTATVSGHPPRGPQVTSRSSATVLADQLPAIKVAKTTSPPRFDAAGTTLTYSYKVTNIGNVTLDPVTVSDNTLGAVTNCPATSLAPGKSMTCTATTTTTQGDVDRGSLSNTGTATGTPPSGDRVSADSPLTVEADQNPALTLRKTARPTRFTQPGTRITYTYRVTNSGNVTLTPVTVTDDKLGVICSSTSLAPGASMSCHSAGTTTQFDLDHGGISNIGTAVGTGPSGQVATDRSRARVRALQRPAISLRKTASYRNFGAAGITITYFYLVRNTGNVTLDPISVNDSRLGPVACLATTLAPQRFTLCTATYPTTQTDVDGGGITNTGTATGTAPSGREVHGESNLTIPAVQKPTITLVKTASVNSFAEGGTAITYRYLVTNTGNVTLRPVTVTDSRLGPVLCPANALAPQAQMTCTRSTTTTQTDVNNGGITNTGTATGISPDGGTTRDTATITVPAEQKAAIGILKQARPTHFNTAGTTIRYRYVVTNSGNVTLDPVTVTDDKFGALTCPQAALAPTERMICRARHVTTQADLDAGGITNTGTASGTTPNGTVVRDSSSVTVTAQQHPAITVNKTAIPDRFAAAGTLITYHYLVTNTGNLTLHHVFVSDQLPGLSPVRCPNPPSGFTLSPGASVTCTASYRTTQADLDNGRVLNTAVAEGNTDAGATVNDESSATATGNQKPAARLVKSSRPDSFDAPGTLITYRYRVTNTGNVTLHPVTVTDNKLGAVTCPRVPGIRGLAPGDSMTCTATYTTTDADVDHGRVTNTGTVAGTAPDGTQVTDSSTTAVPTAQNPRLRIAKSADVSGLTRPGTTITYTYTVTNTGNVTLHDVTVTDPKPGLSSISCPRTRLTPGASMTCRATYTTTQANLDAGRIHNTGTAAGTAPDRTRVTARGSHTVEASQGPVIAIVKTASVTSFHTAGIRVSYHYTVSNDGNVTLHRVTVTDKLAGLSGITCPRTRLTPGASMTCTAHYTTTQADVRRGRIDNTGLATGTTFIGLTMKARTPFTVPAPQRPAITPPPPQPSPTSPPPPFVPGPGLTGAGPLSSGSALAAILGIVTTILIALIALAAARGSTRRSRRGPSIR